MAVVNLLYITFEIWNYDRHEFWIFYFGSWMWGMWENVVFSVSSDASLESEENILKVSTIGQCGLVPLLLGRCFTSPVGYSDRSFAIRRVNIYLLAAGKLQWVITGFAVVSVQINQSLLSSFWVLFAAYFFYKIQLSSIYILSYLSILHSRRSLTVCKRYSTGHRRCTSSSNSLSSKPSPDWERTDTR